MLRVLLLVALLATPAAAQEATLETRYWTGAQQGVQTTVVVGAPWVLRWQRFSGLYVADTPSYTVRTERLSVGTGAFAIGWDHIAWGPPFGVSFEGLVVEARGEGFSVSWLPMGWDVSLSLQLSPSMIVGYTEQRRFGGGCSQYPYCDNSGPYLEVRW